MQGRPGVGTWCPSNCYNHSLLPLLSSWPMQGRPGVDLVPLRTVDELLAMYKVDYVDILKVGGWLGWAGWWLVWWLAWGDGAGGVHGE